MSDIETLIELWDMPNGSDELSRDARAEFAALRAAAAERDEQKKRADEKFDSYERVNGEYSELQKKYNRSISRENEMRLAITAQSAQLEQARAALDRIVELGRDSHDVGDDVRWREMWHVAVEEVEGRLEANAPAPEAEATK